MNTTPTDAGHNFEPVLVVRAARKHRARAFNVALKRAILIGWAVLIVSALTTYLIRPDWFQPENLGRVMQQVGPYVLVAYLLVSLARGLTLLPSTPFIVAGALLFPEQPGLIFLISMIGVVFSAGVIYGLSEYLGFDEFFHRKFPHKIKWIHRKLDSPVGGLFVIGWAFFPLVPTDLVCYVAGIARMRFFLFLTAITLGEIPLVAAYVWGVDALKHFVTGS